LNEKQIILIGALIVFFIAFLVIVNILDNHSINGIKAKTVGDGQHGTARWATRAEIKKTFSFLPFEPEKWRKGENLPTVQGTIIGCRGGKNTTAIVDTGDVHTMMIGAAGVGKTAFFLYPNIEFCCASGMSFINSDTKGDVARNYGEIAKKYYGYNVSVLDLRNPTRSDENNILHLVNKYMDIYLSDKTQLSAKAKAEKYAKITAKTIINIGGGDSASYGQNAYFYDSAEGLLSSIILLLAEFGEKNERHIVSVFKLIQDLIAKPTPKNAKHDNCKSQSEFIEKAISFYIGYLDEEKSVNYISPIITETVKATIAGTEQRLSRLMFKVAVELGKISNMLAAVNDIDDETLRQLQSMCVNEVRKINGIISYEDAVEFQKE